MGTSSVFFSRILRLSTWRTIRYLVCVGCIVVSLSADAGAQTPATVPAPTGSNVNRAGSGPVLTIQTMTLESDVVAQGVVRAVRSEWNAAKTKIYSTATIEVVEMWRGDAATTTLLVRYPGGEVGAVGELYTHIPAFRTDEEVVVFTKRGEDGTSRIVAGLQGKMLVSRDADGTKKTGGMPLADLKKAIQSSKREN